MGRDANGDGRSYQRERAGAIRQHRELFPMILGWHARHHLDEGHLCAKPIQMGTHNCLPL